MPILRKFCPACRGREIVRNGRGRLLCRACKRTFAEKGNAFPRHRFSEGTILEAVLKAKSGSGPTEISRSLLRERGISVSRQTIYSWIRKNRETL